MFDTVIRNGRIIDGTGNVWYRADLGIRDGKIAAIGRLGSAEAARTIDAADRYVMPGFIDIHSHADVTVAIDPRAESAVRQGVTTLVVGNCGLSAAPITGPDSFPHEIHRSVLEQTGFDPAWRSMGEYLDTLRDRGIATNVAALVGHGTLRAVAMGTDDRAASADEVQAMCTLAARALDEGAFGLSSGLEYIPAHSSDTDELVALCRVAAERGRFYATHVRYRDYQAEEGVREALEIAERSGVPLQISHLTPRMWAPRRALERMIAMVDEAAARGMDVTFDAIVVNWGSGTPKTLLPRWVFEGTVSEIQARLRDPDTRERMKRWVGVTGSRFPQWKFGLNGQWDELVVYASSHNPGYVGNTMRQIGRDRGQDPYDALLDLVLEEGEDWPGLRFSGPSHDEDDLRTTIQHPRCMIESDGLALATDGPLADVHNVFTYGWVARMLGKYVRDEQLVSIEDAVRKMTSLPAQRVGLRDRGLLREGLWADVVVVNWEQVQDHTSPQVPSRYASGFETVLVNGQVVFDGRETTGALPGKALRA